MPLACFNPHPPLLAGETLLALELDQQIKVSIHTRHYWRVKRPANLTGVSIHTRHYWRVKRTWASWSAICTPFQSTPAITGG